MKAAKGSNKKDKPHLAGMSIWRVFNHSSRELKCVKHGLSVLVELDRTVKRLSTQLDMHRAPKPGHLIPKRELNAAATLLGLNRGG